MLTRRSLLLLVVPTEPSLDHSPAMVDQTSFVQYAVDGVGLPAQLATTEGLQITVLR